VQEAVASLVRAGLRNPFQVNVAVASISAGAPKQVTPSSLYIKYAVVPGDQKVAQLLAFLQEHKQEKTIVYALTCASVDWLGAALPRLPGGGAVPVLALHGNMKQAKARRQLVLELVSIYTVLCAVVVYGRPEQSCRSSAT
jgi:ATP-dependent RNA helicase DDX55/SPB4